MNVSLPMHHNDVVLVGRVDLVHVAQGHINAILLTVATGGDPLKIIICPRSPPPPGLQRGDTLWVRGRLACDPAPQRKALHYIEAAHIEVVKRRHEHGQLQARSTVESLTS
jgi:hypothetical protein